MDAGVVEFEADGIGFAEVVEVVTLFMRWLVGELAHARVVSEDVVHAVDGGGNLFRWA